jgi:predicted nucleic acid-binding protein
MIYALDSNIVSYMIKRDRAVSARYLAEATTGHECIIPPIVYYEVKRGLLAVNATAQIREFERLCRDFGIGRMNIEAWTESARLYAQHRQTGTLVDDADLFVAAFCKVNDYTLVTNNTRHFQRISGLRLVNWAE